MKKQEKQSKVISRSARKEHNGTTPMFFQPKLNVGVPGDRFETEADRAADSILAAQSMSENTFFTPPQQATQPIQSQTITLIEKTDEMDRLRLQHEEVSDEDWLQARSDKDVAIPDNFETTLNSSKGAGSPLPYSVKSQMETGFGADFSGVNIHTGANAVKMSRQIGAQAFTHGNDIYFNEGKFNPGPQEGRHLIAHELAHTLQQGASVQSKMIQRATDDNPASATPPPGVTPISEETGKIIFKEKHGTTTFESSANKILRLPKISISEFKKRNKTRFQPPLTIPSGRNTDQVNKWKEEVKRSSENQVLNKIKEATFKGGFNKTENPDDRTYFFKGKRNKKLNIFANKNQLSELAIFPIWNITNEPTAFQVDHIVEHQLGGSDEANNYELLEASANSSSGSSIAWEINKRIKHAHDILSSKYYQSNERAEKPDLPPPPGKANQFVNTFLNNNITVTFNDFDFGLDVKSGQPGRYWTLEQIKEGEHIKGIVPLTGKELLDLGTEDDPALFISSAGGKRLIIPEKKEFPRKEWLPRVDLLSRPDFMNLTLQVDAYKARETRKPQVSASYPNMTWYLIQLPGTYIFYVDKETTLENAKKGTTGVFQSLRLPGMSPIRIDSLDLTDAGFRGAGKVLPDIPMISNADIDIVIEGNGVRLRKLFSADELNFPPPFEIRELTLEVSFGTDGLGASGSLNFGINDVGEGYLSALATTSKGFALEGAFDFDSELFDPAQIKAEYKENEWKVEGIIGIPEGKVCGIKSAYIQVNYVENIFTATGEAELDIPGIKKGNMEVKYGDSGFSIRGDFDLKDDIPGIKGGSVSATIAKQEGEEDYSVKVTGTAQSDIPGITSTLSVNYDNDALIIEGSAAYSRGMLGGTVNIGATNRAIGEDGLPSDEPDGNMRVYGGGSLTLQLTPWLAATASVKFLPNGEIEVTARLTTDVFNVFDRIDIAKDLSLFQIPTVEIPLFAIPLGPKSIGLVAQINGGLYFNAGVGPGQLRDLSAEITYNPEHEEETTLKGHGKFVIPADAGLSLRADLTLGVSIVIASLTGGIEIAGNLGLEGEAAAEADVNWSSVQGLILDASGSIMVNPKFTFNLNALARGSLGIGWFSISDSWRYNLVSFQWGPDIQFGIIFPVHYEEGQPFNMSMEDLRVIYPDLNIAEMAVGLARNVKDKIFD